LAHIGGWAMAVNAVSRTSPSSRSAALRLLRGSGASSRLYADKREVQKQWDSNPCGAETVRSEAAESLAFYRAIREHRYTSYGPWFDSVMPFDSVRGKDVLEIGVGLGSDHFRFASNGNRMTALDLSREHLRHTARHLRLEGLTTEPTYGDAERMPFGDASFDVVYSFGVLHHTPNIEAALSEVQRVLRPGGAAIIGLYHRHSFFFWVQIVLVAAVLKLGLVRKGFRRVISEIEYRDDVQSANPLVHVYSRRQVRQFFADYASLSVSTCHVEPDHFHRLKFLVRRLKRDHLERWFGRGGWYVVAKAVK
jgi:ubiquinone/menaquinone biosynthesis C-methylase UbiE